MKKKLLLLLIFCFPFISCAQPNKKVLIIGIDGCRPDALQVAKTPNPVKDTIEIQLSNGNFGFSSIEIYQSDGRKLFQKELTELNSTLDFSAYPDGLDFLSIEINGQQHLKKKTNSK